MHTSLKQISEQLTRTIVGKINTLPTPVKVAMGFLPGGGAATSYADLHKSSIIRLAEHYEKEGKLTKEASYALSQYKKAHQAEKKAHERLLRVFARNI